MSTDSPAKSFTARSLRLLDRLGPLLALIVVWILFASLEWRTFASWANMQSILLQTAVVGIAALGGTMIIISGGIDLSIGSLIALVAVVIALLIQTLSQGPPEEAILSPNMAAAVASLAGIVAGGLCGLMIGAMVIGQIGRVASILAGGLAGLFAWHYGFAWFIALPLGVALAFAGWWTDRKIGARIPLLPFIVTLAMLGAFRGIAKGLAQNTIIYSPETWLTRLMQLPTAKPDWQLLVNPSKWWSPGVWVFLLLSVFVAALLRYTQFGRHVFAIGSNEQTARLCGIDVERTKLKIYTFALTLGGVAGMMQFSFMNMGDPMTAQGYELKVIAAVVIGGASLTGGVGSILGTVAGALLMTIIDNGCTKIGLENWVQEILTGAIIVAAVALDQIRRRASS